MVKAKKGSIKKKKTKSRKGMSKPQILVGGDDSKHTQKGEQGQDKGHGNKKTGLRKKRRSGGKKTIPSGSRA